jgi:hypothetical protein
MEESEFRTLLRETKKYPPRFRRDVERLSNRDPSGLGSAVKFLEADPWFFRSGYAKAEIIKLINRVDIPEQYASRLRRVALQIIDKGDRREFRSYCRLAHKVYNEELREALLLKMRDKDPGVKRRARWMFEACEKKG